MIILGQLNWYNKIFLVNSPSHSVVALDICLIFSLKQTLWDKDAVYQYDPKYSTIVLGASGHIATNPTYPELLLVSDHASDSLFTFNVTDGKGWQFATNWM